MRCDSCGEEKVTVERDGGRFCLACLSGGKALAARGPKAAASPSGATPVGAPVPAGARDPAAGPVPPGTDGPSAAASQRTGLTGGTVVLCPSCSARISTDLDRDSPETIPCLQCDASFVVRDAESPGMTAALVPRGLERPLGVNILGWLNIAGGAAGLGMAALYVWAHVERPFWYAPPTTALMLYVLLLFRCAMSVALIVCGSAMRAGGRWVWYLASALYMSGIVASLALIVTLPSGRSYHCGPLVLYLALYGYMTTGGVRAFFDLPERVGLKTYLTELGIAVALALITVPMGHHAEALRYERERRTEILALLKEGTSHLAEHKYDQAIDDLTKVIELDPDLAVAYNSRGMAYAMKRNLDRAMDDFERALELDPDGPAGRQARQALELLEGR